MARALSASAGERRLAAGVAALAVAVYLGALANGFAWDDVPIVGTNELVHHVSGLWRAFATPYWPPAWGGYLYRPLTVATYALDWLVSSGAPWWFHLVNLLWHAATTVLVALLARRWASPAAGWIAGAVFAVHPVHVEAVANVVGRAELGAALFVIAGVWLALERDALWASLAAWVAGLLCKENAAVLPALVATGWLLALPRPRPGGRRIRAYVAAWVAVGAAYAVVRHAVFGPFAVSSGMAVVFTGQSPLTVRLTAVAALADVARLLVFPLTLRADYSPNERTAVTGPGDPRFLAGLACLLIWAGLLWLAWRRGRRVEALGLAWVGIACLPVANLVMPVGVLVAERTLYLPSVGLALAAGAALAGLRPRLAAGARHAADAGLALLVAGGAARSALRVPVWKSTTAVYRSIVRDSPRSYVGPMVAAVYAEREGRYGDALEAFRHAADVFPGDHRLPLRAAEMAYRLGRPALADSLLARIDSTCVHCDIFFRAAAIDARARGQAAVADSLLAHLARLDARRRP